MTTSVNLSLTALPAREGRQTGSTSTAAGGDFARILFGASRDVRAKLAARPENSAAQMFRQEEPRQPAEPANETKADDALPERRERARELRAESARPKRATDQRQVSVNHERIEDVAWQSPGESVAPARAARAGDGSATQWHQEFRKELPAEVAAAPHATVASTAAPTIAASTTPPANPAAAVAKWFRAQLPLARPANSVGVVSIADRPQTPGPATTRSASRPDAPLPQKSDAETDGVDAPLSAELSKWISAMRLRHSSGESRAEIDLTPPELGRMRVSVSLVGDDLHVEVQTETDEAGAAVRSQLDRLRGALERLGVRVAQLDVQTAAVGQSSRGGAIAPVRADGAESRDAKTASARRREHRSQNARSGARAQVADEEAEVRV